MSGRRKARNRGPKGPIGLTGVAGVAGAAGATSLSSATPFWQEPMDPEDVYPIPGPAGVAGVAGAAGIAGAMGLPGLDGIDGEDAMAPFGWPAFGVTTLTTGVTGAQNDYNPGLGKFTVEHWNGVADAAFTGLRGGAAGSIYIFKNTGTKVATFAHQSAASAAGNKFTHPVTSAPLPVAKGGYLAAAHDGATWQLIGHEQGHSIAPAFSAAVFSGAGGMTWTVDPADVQVYEYVVDGMRGLMTVFCGVATTTVGGVLGTQLLVTIPGGFSFGGAQAKVNAGGRITDNVTETVGLIFTNPPTPTQIVVMKYPSLAAYTAAVNTTTVQFTIELDVS